MSYDINRVVLIGRLTRNPELKYTAGGTAVSKIAVAVGGRKTANGEETVSFLPITLFGKSASNIVQYLHKGDRLAVDGRIQQTRWNDKDGNPRNAIEIIADHVEYLTAKQSAGQTLPEPEGEPLADIPHDVEF